MPGCNTQQLTDGYAFAWLNGSPVVQAGPAEYMNPSATPGSHTWVWFLLLWAQVLLLQRVSPQELDIAGVSVHRTDHKDLHTAQPAQVFQELQTSDPLILTFT
jgi:hypothetical protein